MVCAACGAYTSPTRVANLAVQCKGAPPPGGGAARLAPLLAGRTIGGGAIGLSIPPTLLRSASSALAAPRRSTRRPYGGCACTADRSDAPRGRCRVCNREALASL